jgi:hypothetical protein
MKENFHKISTNRRIKLVAYFDTEFLLSCYHKKSIFFCLYQFFMIRMGFLIIEGPYQVNFKKIAWRVRSNRYLFLLVLIVPRCTFFGPIFHHDMYILGLKYISDLYIYMRVTGGSHLRI